MSNNMPCLDNASKGFDELSNTAPQLKKAIDIGKEQASTRDRVIQTVNEMCDALQMASDLTSTQLSSAITEFNRVRWENEKLLRGYFERLAKSVSKPALRKLLSEGHVCGDLHKVGDRFRTPFAPESISGLGTWEAVNTFFTRSSNMSRAVDGLVEGERSFINDYYDLLNDVRTLAESATAVPLGNKPKLETAGEEIIKLIREKRNLLQQKIRVLRENGNKVIQALH